MPIYIQSKELTNQLDEKIKLVNSNPGNPDFIGFN